MVEFKVEIPEERKKELQEGRTLLKDIWKEIERAKRAGLDVSDLEASAMDTEERLEKLIKEYVEE